MSACVRLVVLGLLPLCGFARPAPASQLSNEHSSLTLFFQNNLNASDDTNHVGALLLDAGDSNAAGEACQALGETLLTQATVENYTDDFSEALAYLEYAYGTGPSYRIDTGIVSLSSDELFFAAVPSDKESLPVLCTQSSSASQPPNSSASPLNEITLASGSNKYIGYRNQKSFRFLGIRYADPPQRFEYSRIYSGTGETVNATGYGSQCTQPKVGGEDCLFLNIQTPYIPKAGSQANLRPVLFWIHGGGFTGGTGSDPQTDGGNLASREDMVVVTFNYRLSTLGFLAIPGTDIQGNFGVGDQIVALQWTIANIASFGGDPGRITIMGDSAGAGSVRVLLGSPAAIGLFQGAIAMSNLGGGQDLGLDSNYGTTYSKYYTVNESFTVAGPQIFNATNCTSSSLSEEIACLKQVNATQLVSLDAVARYVVQDGTIVNTPQLGLTGRNGYAAYVPVIFGTTANDGASFSTYVANATNLTYALEEGLSIEEHWANEIIDSGLFPFHDTGNFTIDAFNVTQRVATDNTFRCVDEATVYAGAVTGTFPAAYYYDFDREINGFNPNDLPGAPITPSYPNGNPNLPYFRLHSGDLPWVFGNFFVPLRDANDLYSVQLVSAYWAEFVKTGQPNPDPEYLKVRGRSYQKTLEATEATGPWERVQSENGPIKYLDYPARTGDFVDKPQCAWLNYSLDLYLHE